MTHFIGNRKKISEEKEEKIEKREMHG